MKTTTIILLLFSLMSFAGELIVKAPQTKHKVFNGQIQYGARSYRFDELKDIRVAYRGAAPSKVKISLTLKSKSYLPGTKVSEEVELALMKFKRNGSVYELKNKKLKKLITSSKKLRPKLNCGNAVQISSKEKDLIVDLSQLTSLAACTGAEIYAPSGIGKRDVAVNRNGKDRNNYTIQEDIALGNEFSRSFIRSNKKIILDSEHPMTVHLQARLDEIASVSDMPELRPKVHVINADVLNAFALPGGNIFVFRGLIENVDNEASLMGVLGHEWAHVTARHGTKRLSRDTKIITAFVLAHYAGKIASSFSRKTWKRIAFSVGADLTLLGGISYISWKSRVAESEADRLGAHYAYLANYDPTGVAQTFSSFKRLYPTNANFVEKMFASHPEHDQRIEENYILSSLFYPEREDSIISSANYDAAYAELQKIPASSQAVSMQAGEALEKTFDPSSPSALLKMPV